jgi:hypothetical protein
MTGTGRGSAPGITVSRKTGHFREKRGSPEPAAAILHPDPLEIFIPRAFVRVRAVSRNPLRLHWTEPGWRVRKFRVGSNFVTTGKSYRLPRPTEAAQIAVKKYRQKILQKSYQGMEMKKPMTTNLKVKASNAVDNARVAAHAAYDDATVAAHNTLRDATVEAQKLSNDVQIGVHKAVADAKIAVHEAGSKMKKR